MQFHWSKAVPVAALVGAISLAAGSAQAPDQPVPEPEPWPVAEPADVQSINAIIEALYNVVSGPPTIKRDWARMRSLFLPEGRMVTPRPQPDGGTIAVVLTVDAYIKFNRKYLEQAGFVEREVARRVEEYGNIAHVFSTYESRRRPQDPSPYSRGINSIQLLRDGDRWWIVTVMWDHERQDNPIPAKYLPTEG